MTMYDVFPPIAAIVLGVTIFWMSVFFAQWDADLKRWNAEFEKRRKKFGVMDNTKTKKDHAFNTTAIRSQGHE